ncbi:MAG: hypothetical protein JWQ11_3492 [Rhizobacter sp.]|nr:hypothetical protein [Rhizobacter sp.]
MEIAAVSLLEANPRTGTTEVVTIFGKTTDGRDLVLSVRGAQLKALMEVLKVTVRP